MALGAEQHLSLKVVATVLTNIHESKARIERLADIYSGCVISSARGFWRLVVLQSFGYHYQIAWLTA